MRYEDAKPLMLFSLRPLFSRELRDPWRHDYNLYQQAWRRMDREIEREQKQYLNISIVLAHVFWNSETKCRAYWQNTCLYLKKAVTSEHQIPPIFLKRISTACAVCLKCYCSNCYCQNSNSNSQWLSTWNFNIQVLLSTHIMQLLGQIRALLLTFWRETEPYVRALYGQANDMYRQLSELIILADRTSTVDWHNTEAQFFSCKA